MFIHTEKRAVLVRPHEAAGILQCVPHARQLRDKDGEEFYAIPHRIEEAKVLRNLGLKVPSPILSHYDWPRGPEIEQPFAAQRETAAFFTLHNRAHCHNGLGSGKTLASLWAYDYLRSAGLAHKLLVVATLSTLEPAWQETIEAHLPHLRCVVVYGTRKKREALLALPADVYIVNHDGAVILASAFAARADIDTVIIDEIAEAARNARTARWRALHSICNGVQYRLNSRGELKLSTSPHPKKLRVWGLTGTPIPNAPTDAFAQAKLVTPGTVPMRFTEFKNQVMRQVSTFRWIAKPDALDRVFELLAPSIRFSREECVDLPPTTYTHRHVPLTVEQKKSYQQMFDHLVAEADDGRITAANEGVKASKLVQICTGSCYGTTGKALNVNAKPRLDEVLSIVHESETKTLVFVPFVSAIAMVLEFLRKAGVSAEAIYGDVSKAERDRIFGLFQHTNDVQVIVAQPGAMAHGLTLVSASTIVWYAPTTRPDHYEQANGRITRPGQKHNTLIVHIEGSPIEKKMYDRLKTKASMQGILLNMIREGRE
jgi:SNF2 family DNA or RNA helicase